MPAGERTFVMKFLGDTRGIGGSFDKINGEFRQLDKSLSTTQKVAAGIGTSNLIANLGAGFTGKLMGSANAASNLTEAMNKSMVVFGEYDHLIQAFGKDSANTFGISRRAAHEYAGTLGQILRAGGLTQEASAGMSVELLKLAADMASFNNISIDEALEKIRAGLVGETEPLRTVGVLLSQAAVEAKAMEMGISDGSRALTEQEKVQARYAIILEQTKSAQGDFARTANEAANSQRRVAAEGENAAAVVGGPTNEAFNLLRNTWLLIPPIGREIISTAALLAGGLAVVAAVLPSAITGFGLMAASASALGVAIAAAFPFLLVGGAVAAIIASGYLLFRHWDELKEKAHQVRSAVLGTVGLENNSAAQRTFDSAGMGFLKSLPVVGSIYGAASNLRNFVDGSGGGGTRGELSLDGYATGGMVPGPRGAPQLAIVHGGERVLTPGQQGGMSIHINVEGSVHDDASLQAAILAALHTAQQRGSLGFA